MTSENNLQRKPYNNQVFIFLNIVSNKKKKNINETEN